MKPIHVYNDLTIFAEMVAAVEVKADGWRWQTIVTLPMGATKVVGQFQCTPGKPDSVERAKQSAMNLKYVIEKEVEAFR